MSDGEAAGARGASWWIPRVLVAVIAVSLLILGPPAWRHLTKKEVWSRLPQPGGGEAIGVQWVRRSDGWPLAGTVYEGWHVGSGTRAFMMEDIVKLEYTTFTYWNDDGEISRQMRMVDRTGTINEGPNWWNGHGRHDVPTAPWLESGKTADEFWNQVRPR